MNKETSWTVVGSKKKKPPVQRFAPPALARPQLTHELTHHHPTPGVFRSEKISEPCWFFNNGGCRHKDGSNKTADECKYLHVSSENVKRPPHLSSCKPCDKYNLEGECKWFDNCKYSHRVLTNEEWNVNYPTIPFTLRSNVQKRLLLENRMYGLEGRIKVLEYKQEGMSRDLQNIGRNLQQLLRSTF